MALSCDHFSYNACYPDRVPFKVLLQRLLESHDAEIEFLKDCLKRKSSCASGTHEQSIPTAQILATPMGEDNRGQIATTEQLARTSRQTVPIQDTSLDTERSTSWEQLADSLTYSDDHNSFRDSGGASKASTADKSFGDEAAISAKLISEQIADRIDVGLLASQLAGAAPRNAPEDDDEQHGSLLSADTSAWYDMESEDPMHYTSYARLCYVVDTWISKRRSQSIALAGTLFVFVIIFGLLWTFCFHDEDKTWLENIFEGLWVAWTFMADPGTHGQEEQQSRRFIGALIAASGIIFMAATLGMVVDVIREKMEALRQGKSSVVERDHSLILGWSEKAVSIIEELCFANESDGGGTIVVLSHATKEFIERDLAMQLPPSSRKGTRIVCRTGNPMLISDLLKVAAPTARATIILSNEGDPDNSDAETLRVMLSLRTLPYKMEGHVVAEVRDIDNEPLVKMVGGTVAETMVSHDVLGRLMLMSARQPGLAKVYESLLGFQGDEFYMHEWPDLVDVKFGSLVERFPDAVPIGVCTEDGDLIVNPNRDRTMLPGEKVFVIAEDDDTYRPEQPVEVEEGKPPHVVAQEPSPEKILFCGWRRDIRDIVLHLDGILQKGSEIHMITASVPPERRTEVLLEEGLDVSKLTRIRLVQHYGNPSMRRRLSALPLAEFNSCMIFSDKAYETDTMQSDSQSLATLLLLRDLQETKRVPKGLTDDRVISRGSVRGRVRGSEVARACPVICEVLDPRTQKTISCNKYVSRSSEFCQTNKISAQLLAMVSENRNVNVLFKQLLGARGNSVNVYPSGRYARCDETISFWTLAKRASSMGETLIGHIAVKSQQVSINPRNKNERQTWEDADLVVISYGEGKVQSKELAHESCRKDAGISDAIASFVGLLKDMNQDECIRFMQAQETIQQMALQCTNLRFLKNAILR